MKQIVSPFKMINRYKCVVCESDFLKSYRDLVKFPIYMGVTELPMNSDIFMDQEWAVCENCFCLQLISLVPLEILYSINHSVEAVGRVWQAHHEEFAKTIIRESPSSICEIGGSHGYLAKIITSNLPDIRYLMIEPSPTFESSRIEIVKGFFEDNSEKTSGFDSIVHSHVLEHLYDPVKFMTELNKNVNYSSNIHMSIPNINELLLKFGSNALNFEHTYFLTLENLDFMARKTGFEIINVENYIDHSFFITMKKAKKHQIDLERIKKTNKIYAKNFDSLWDGLGQFVEETKFIINKKSEIPTYIFGAHVFTQSLYQLGLNQCNIDGVLDNATMKIGKRLYGTPYRVFHPETIRDMTKVRVILKAASYQNEIKKQLIELNSNVEIIE
jgi:hypothetical protein